MCHYFLHEGHVVILGIRQQLRSGNDVVKISPVVVIHFITDRWVRLYFPVVVGKSITMIIEIRPHGLIDNHVAAPRQIFFDPLSRLILGISLPAVPENERVIVIAEVRTTISGP